MTSPRIQLPDGPGGPAERLWTLRPEMAPAVWNAVEACYAQSILSAREREALRFRIAQLNQCPVCLSYRAETNVANGASDDLYDHVAEWRTWPGYTDRERLAIEFAERFATDHLGIDDDLFARLHAQYSDAEILDLAICAQTFLGLGRVLSTFGIEPGCTLDLAAGETALTSASPSA
jgi:AhpD family alkylhydroperoxidase